MPPSPRDLFAHRSAVTGHCYRMLGSASEADDAAQETMVRAWRAIDRFEGRSSIKTWLFRIATNVCLDAIADGKRRLRAYDVGGPMSLEAPDATELPAETWVEPIADGLVVPEDADPAERALLKESVRLAFVAALQHLPPKQRAALLLTEVLGFSAQETAETLSTTVASVNSALQRARETLAQGTLDRLHEPLPSHEARLLDAFVHAFERYDVPAITELLRVDATQSMPPFRMWLDGAAAIARWMAGPGAGCRGSRLALVDACGCRAIAQYRRSEEVPRGGPEGGHAAWALIVLDAIDDRIDTLTYFLDVEAIFPRLGLPLTLERGAAIPAPAPTFSRPTDETWLHGQSKG